MPPGLIFDLDGTLIDSLPGIAHSLNHALSTKGLAPHPNSAVRSFIGDGALVLAQRALPNDSPPSLAHEIEAAFKLDYADTWRSGTTLYPGIAELISTLSATGHPLAILSNKPHSFCCEFAAHFFPQQPFSQVLGQAHDTPKKPAPEAALKILAHWSIAAENARFIGDSTVDLATAANAGIPFIGVAWGYHNPKRLGPQIANSSDELPDLLR